MLQKLRDPSVRKKYFEKDLMAFILWYFPESVTYAFSDYHKMYIRSLELGHNTFNKTFRKWGATVLAKYFIIWVIVYKKFRYIVYVSADKNSSSAKLFDIAIQLQTNRRLVADYGQLYFDDDYSKGNKKKTQNLFITENSIKVQSMSIKTSLRGAVYGVPGEGEFRPDLLALDDVDTNLNTKNSNVITDNYRMFTEEFIGAMGDNGQILFMGNTIRSDGVVPRVQRDFKRWDQYVVPLFNRKTGELTRPERYTRTNEEGKDRIQDLRENYTKTSWMTNFLLRPYDGENMVERGWIKFVDKRPKRFDWVCVGDDPAISMNNHTDRHALVVVGKKGDDYYVLDCAILKGKEKSQKNTTQTTYNLYKKWKANVINFESVGFQSRDADILKKMGCAVTLIRPHKDKITRFRDVLEYPLEKGHVFFLPDAEEVARELMTFPNGEYDDSIDALVYAVMGTKGRRSRDVLFIDTYI